MRFLASLLIISALSHYGNAQSCSSTFTTCSSCLSIGNRWCASIPDGFASGGCCTSTFNRCSSFYPYSYRNTCSSYDDVTFDRPCDTVCIVVNVLYSVAWFVNMIMVVRYCRQRNIEPCGYIAIAFFFSFFVWCCLISRGRQQLVIVQTGNIPYQAQTGAPISQPYGQPSYGQPYGQPSYGQPYGGQQGGYVPPAQPVNPYVQPSYGQPYGQVVETPPNPYAQPSNAYGEISKPQ